MIRIGQTTAAGLKAGDQTAHGKVSEVRPRNGGFVEVHFVAGRCLIWRATQTVTLLAR